MTGHSRWPATALLILTSAAAAAQPAAPPPPGPGTQIRDYGLVVRAPRSDARRDQLMRDALQAWEQENFIAAERQFRRLLGADSGLAMAWIGIMASNLRLGQYQQVLQWARRIPAELQDDPYLRILEAQAVDVLHGPQAALEVLVTQTRNCTIRTARAAYLLRVQLPTDALAMYLAVLRDCPDRLDAALGFVMTAALTDRFRSAWDVFWQIRPFLDPQVGAETSNYLQWLQQRKRR